MSKIIFGSVVAIFCCNSLLAVSADIIFFGGDILTIDERQPSVEAVAVKDGRILFAGSQHQAFSYKDETTQSVDLQGKTMLPGFIDAHTHILAMEILRTSLDLSPLTHPDFDDILKILKDAAAKGPVTAFGYDPSLMKKTGELNFQTLDAVSMDTPILVVNKSGHIAYGNHAAFAAAGVDDSTPDPIGGSYQKKDGKLTGVAFEVPPIVRLLSSSPAMKGADYDKMAEEAARWYARNGYTTITDLGLGLPIPKPLEDIEYLRKAVHASDAAVRIQGYLVYPFLDHFKEIEKLNDDRFRLLGVKIWSDGSLQGHTGALEKDYKDVHSEGKLNYSQSELDEMVLTAHKQGIQVAVHANGDKAIKDTLHAYEMALKASPAEDPRFRVEHATLADKKLLKKMVSVKATPSFTPLHIYYYGEVFEHQILGKARAEEIDSGKSAQDVGLKFSYNDDSLGILNPLELVQIAVTRKMLDGAVLNPEERISVEEGLRCMTIYPAWQTFREKDLGSIEKGKFADFVLLDKNPLKVSPDKLKEIKVLQTWLNGKPVDWGISVK